MVIFVRSYFIWANKHYNTVCYQNNPWITHSIIVSVNQCDTLYHKWRKSRKKKCKEREKDYRGGACMCEICSHKRYFYTQYKEHRKKT